MNNHQMRQGAAGQTCRYGVEWSGVERSGVVICLEGLSAGDHEVR